MNSSNAWIIVKWVFFFFVLSIVLLISAYALGWINAPLETMSAENVQRLSREANEEWQSLQAQLSSIDDIESRAWDMVSAYGEDQSVWPQGKRDEYLQLRQQRQNLVSAYNRACGQYNSLWQDEWREIPAPNDLPTSCEMYGE